jgi:uncharacterized protein (DUF427 family)
MTQTRPDAHRLEIVESDLHVRVRRNDVELADTRRPVLLAEGTLPTRYYIPRSDVRMELLTPTDTRSHCPFKGDATYWSLAGTGGDEEVPDIAWCYETPIEGAAKIAGLVCFFNEKVDLEVDDRAVERPKTRWS